MTTSLFIKIRGILEQLGCTWLIKNDDAGIIYAKNESVRTIFKDTDEVLYSLASAPPDYLGQSKNREFVITAMEYDRIKTVEIDLSVKNLNAFLVEIGENPDDYKDFISSIAEYTPTKLPTSKVEDKIPSTIDLSERTKDAL